MSSSMFGSLALLPLQHKRPSGRDPAHHVYFQALRSKFVLLFLLNGRLLHR